MKHIKKFEGFWNKHTDRIEYEYLRMDIIENGNMKLSLTDEGKEKVKEDGINYENFIDYFDDIRANSEYVYWESIGDAGLAMSDAPCITDGYYFDDDGIFTDEKHDDSEIFWYPDYVVKDFTEELYKKGYVIFETNKPKTKEEIEKRRFKNDTKKYNL